MTRSGTAGDFVEIGVGGESRNRAVAEVDGCDLTLKRCAQEVAQDAFAQAVWAFARAHENDVVGHEEVAGHGLGGQWCLLFGVWTLRFRTTFRGGRGYVIE